MYMLHWRGARGNCSSASRTVEASSAGIVSESALSAMRSANMSRDAPRQGPGRLSAHQRTLGVLPVKDLSFRSLQATVVQPQGQLTACGRSCSGNVQHRDVWLLSTRYTDLRTLAQRQGICVSVADHLIFLIVVEVHFAGRYPGQHGVSSCEGCARLRGMWA